MSVWSSEPPKEDGYYWALLPSSDGPETVERDAGFWYQLGAGYVLPDATVRGVWQWLTTPLERPAEPYFGDTVP